MTVLVLKMDTVFQSTCSGSYHLFLNMLRKATFVCCIIDVITEGTNVWGKGKTTTWVQNFCTKMRPCAKLLITTIKFELFMNVKNGSWCITYSKLCHGFPISIGGKTQGCFALRTLGCPPPFQRGNELVLWYIFISSGTCNFLPRTTNPLIIYLFRIIYPTVYEIDQDRDYIVHCCLLDI